MPRVDFRLWDRIFILKIICAAQMSFSSFVLILSLYLVILQHWTSHLESRHHIAMYKWSDIGVTLLDFISGILLAIAANMRGKLRRRLLSYWVIIQTTLIPICLFLAMQLYFHLSKSKDCLSTDIHYKRISIVQVLYMLCHYFFIAYTIDFLVSGKQRKKYDPRIRPDNITEPTYPQITTTESRHIRLGQSFLIPNTSNSQIDDDEDNITDYNTIRKNIIQRLLELAQEEDEEKEMATTSSQK